MQPITKQELVHKLHVQHRNTRHDACDIINAYQAEIDEENDKNWQKYCKASREDNKGRTIMCAPKKYMDPNELARRIHNMKQRKPKEGE